MREKLEAVRATIADHVAHISELFNPGVKITVVVRSPRIGNEGDIIVTNDDRLVNVINSIAYAMDRDQPA